jgi:hypothetical protein
MLSWVLMEAGEYLAVHLRDALRGSHQSIAVWVFTDGLEYFSYSASNAL